MLKIAVHDNLLSLANAPIPECERPKREGKCLTSLKGCRRGAGLPAGEISVARCRGLQLRYTLRGRPDRERSYNGVSIMRDNNGGTCNRDPHLENIAAELTGAVYPLVLRHGLRVSWLDLELGLWRALAETIRKVGCEISLPPSI